MRVSVQSYNCNAGNVSINSRHLILGFTKNGIFHGVDEVLAGQAKPIEVFIDQSIIDPDFISDLEYRDAYTPYNFSTPSLGNLDTVICLILKAPQE